MVHLELLDLVVARVPKDSLEHLEILAKQDNEEGLDQEVPLETVDQ